MSKISQDRDRVPGHGEGEDMEKMPKKDEKSQRGGQGQQGQQNWNQGQKGEQGGQPHKGDEMNRPKKTNEDMDDRTKRPA